MRTTVRPTSKSLRTSATKPHFERVRFLASAAHIDRGRVLKGANDPAGALAEFRRALEIDPSNQTAQQEIDILQAARPGQHAAFAGYAGADGWPEEDAQGT